jgi:hypothetical protein
MSDGMSDAAAEGRIYRDVWCAVYDVRATLGGERFCRWSHPTVWRFNELIADLGWIFVPAQYVTPESIERPLDANALWAAAERLRRALCSLNLGHRGWTPTVDPEVDGLLRGSGYELRRILRGGEL